MALKQRYYKENRQSPCYNVNASRCTNELAPNLWAKTPVFLKIPGIPLAAPLMNSQFQLDHRLRQFS